MLHTQRHPPSVPRRPWSLGSLALIAIFASLPVALGSVPALAATTTPSFPVPASAKVPPVGATTATTTTTTPTTYTPQSTAPLPAGTAATGTTPGTGAPTTHASHTNRLSTLAIALIVLAALLILACAAWVAARLTAFEPHWFRSARHALAEGGFRLSATWAEFTDWVRLGR